MSRKLKTTLLVAGFMIVALLATACGLARSPVRQLASDTGAMGGGEAFYNETAEEPAMEAPMPAGAEGDFAAERSSIADSTIVASDGQALQIERLIIRNGSITVSVEDTYDAKAKIEQLVTSMAGDGAFVVSSNESGGGSGSPYINMTIRVPASQFDATMDALEALKVQGTTPSVSESAQDVTEEYVDVSARIESLEAARDRLLELMNQAETTEAVLQAEAQLTQREADIEALKGRLRYLEQSASLSRIDIALQPYILSQPVDTRWRPLETLRRAFDDLLDALRDFADFLIRFVIVVLPFLLIFGAVIYGIVRFIVGRVRAGQRRRAARKAQESEE